MNTISKRTALRSISLAALLMFRLASAQTSTNTCQAQLNALKGVLIFDPDPGEFSGGNVVLYHWYPVTGTDYFIRTDHWDGDALLVEGPLFLGPYDLVLPDSQGVPTSAIPVCFDFTPRILSITKSNTGNCTLTFEGGVGGTYQVQAATNLSPPVFWTTLTNNTDGGVNFIAGPGGYWSHTDLNATNFCARFYRALLPEVQVNYSVSGNTAYVAGSSRAMGAITIAPTYAGYPVTGIGDEAFGSCKGLTSVTIPDSVTNIGQFAFFGCGSLTNIAVGVSNPAYSTLIGVLFDKTRRTLIQFPEGRTGSYVVPQGVTNIGDYAFCFCGSLTNVALACSVTRIGDYAFALSGLMNVTIPDSVRSIGEGAFFASSLVSAAVGESVTSIGDSAFNDCESLTNVVIGHGVATIGDFAFEDCLSLPCVTIPDSVTNIGWQTFFESGLASIRFGAGLTNLEEWLANDYVPDLTNITVAASNPAYSSTDGVLYEKSQTTLLRFPEGRDGSCTIPDSVTSIGGEAFENCRGLTSVTIPDSVVSIGDFVFSDCESLTIVVIGNGVATIGEGAFDCCSGLPNVTIPNSVTNISSYAFQSCSSLTNITFLGNAPALGDSVFGTASGAKVYYYLGTTGWGPSYGGLPTIAIVRLPVISKGSVGVHAGVGFGFNILGLTNEIVTVEASTNLANWQPIWVKRLTAGSIDFVDPQWTNFPDRFYRVLVGPPPVMTGVLVNYGVSDEKGPGLTFDVFLNRLVFTSEARRRRNQKYHISHLQPLSVFQREPLNPITTTLQVSGNDISERGEWDCLSGQIGC
jgi:hypothetical protein